MASLLNTTVGSSNRDEQANSPQSQESEKALQSTRSDGKIAIDQDTVALGFSFPSWKKWMILTVIFAVQTSMNFNASIYSSSISQLTEHYQVSNKTARLGQVLFLIFYAFGCELWAPWSEEVGRWPVLQLSLLFVNLWQIPSALSTNFATILVSRALGGLSSAGGSVTLGMVADMWEAEDQQYAIAYVVLSSVAGSAFGPVAGGFMQEYLSWHWNFWIQLILGVFVQALHFFLVPETRATSMLDKEAKRRRKQNNENVWGPNELREKRLSMKEVATYWYRPFYMFVTEPIVLCLSLLSGFSDALIFTFLDSFPMVFGQYGWGPGKLGLSFIPILLGYVIAYFICLPCIHVDNNLKKNKPAKFTPERRLYWLLFIVALEPLGLFGFAGTSGGPKAGIPWIAPMIFGCLVGIANYHIYYATIDYMVAAYGAYSASATGGNGLARDFLAGIAALYSPPMYENIGSMPLRNGSIILGSLAVVVAVPIYVFYWKGQWFRERSKFAQTLAENRKERGDGHVTEIAV